MFTKTLLTLLLFFIITFQSNSAMADNYSDTMALVDQSTITIKSFGEDPNMVWFRDNVQYAKAVFIVPQMLKAGFFFGGSGGSGVLVSRNMKINVWSYPVFYSMGSVSFGQAVAEQSKLKTSTVNY